MASIFGRRVSDSGSNRKQAIKQYLNKELSINIKKLQRDHISSASAIRSGETVNRVCSCLEAIFLHELKDSYTSKTFWPFIAKFTHRDVVDQIKKLLFIRTEIGQCRAWIRMAVNDCLMDSYFSAILREPSTLKQYYKQGAFLRDAELPLITNDYLQGLSVFTFQLSYNSSVLNMWDTALLLLSGAYLSSDTQSETSDSEKSISVNKETMSEVSQTNSFHEAEMSVSLLREDLNNSISGQEENSGLHLHEGDVHQQKTEGNLQVEEFEDSIVIHLESAEGNSKEDKKVDDRLGDQVGEKVIENTIDENVRSDDIAKVKETESLNPFSLGYSEQTDDEIVFSRNKETKKVQKKKKRENEGDVSVEPEGGAIIEDDLNKGGEDELRGWRNGGQRNMDHSTVAGGVIDEMREEELGGDNEDIYGAKSSGKDGASCRTDTGLQKGKGQVGDAVDVEQKKNNLSDKIQTSIENNSDGKKEIYDYEIVVEGKGPVERNVIVPGGKKMAGVGEDKDVNEGNVAMEGTEEMYEESKGNSLTGMQGWSSDFNQLSSVETPEKDVDNRESYSSMVGKYMKNTITGLKSAEPTQNESGIQRAADQRESEEQNSSSSTEMIEGYEIIPFTTGPLSQYADDRTQALLDMVTKIGHEKGLAAQKFQCRGCSCELGIIFGKHKVCNYDGCYYCSDCHVDEQAVIPARILYNWDFRKHSVACHTKLFLNQVEDMALIDVGKCNPTLYSAISEMEQILILRKQIFYLKAYLFTCKQSVAEELRSKIWPREYMLENFDLYSVRDLLQIQAGTLGPQLKKMIVFAAKHVQQCALCSQKGFICEICENPKIIYPFDTDLTTRCEKCRSVFHKACKTDIKSCPRCLRRKVRSPIGDETEGSTEFPSPFT